MPGTHPASENKPIKMVVCLELRPIIDLATRNLRWYSELLEELLKLNLLSFTELIENLSLM